MKIVISLPPTSPRGFLRMEFEDKGRRCDIHEHHINTRVGRVGRYGRSEPQTAERNGHQTYTN